MKIIAMISQKGGAGETALAVHLATKPWGRDKIRILFGRLDETLLHRLVALNEPGLRSAWRWHCCSVGLHVR